MSILASLFSIIAALILPVAAFIWMIAKRNGYLKPLLLGVLCFGFFQILTRLPALDFLRQSIPYVIFAARQPFLSALFLAGTAALFEEGGRWLVMRFLMRDKRRLTDGIAFGIGHGGLEAAALVGSAVLIQLINEGPSSAPWLTFTGGMERIFAMLIQVGLSVMVLKSVVLKKPLWLLLAFLLHTLIDLGAAYGLRAGMSVLALEAFFGTAALLLLLFIINQYKYYHGGEITCQSMEDSEGSS